MSDDPPDWLHAGAVLVGEAGVLIEGASGGGKSSLAEALLAEAALAGLFARLVGDDRVAVRARSGRLLAAPHPALAGLVERRGTGLVRVPYEPACVLALAVRLVDSPAERAPRLPEQPPRRAFGALALPLLTLWSPDGPMVNARRVLAALAIPTGKTDLF